jgi:hypothetical protein
MSTDSTDRVGYKVCALNLSLYRSRPKTSRIVEEAKVQLGVWVAAKVARIEALARQPAPLGVKKPAAEARSSRLVSTAQPKLALLYEAVV